MEQSESQPKSTRVLNFEPPLDYLLNNSEFIPVVSGFLNDPDRLPVKIFINSLSKLGLSVLISEENNPSSRIVSLKLQGPTPDSITRTQLNLAIDRRENQFVVTGGVANFSSENTSPNAITIKNFGGIVSPIEDALLQSLADVTNTKVRRDLRTDKKFKRFVSNYRVRGYIDNSDDPSTEKLAKLTKTFIPRSH